MKKTRSELRSEATRKALLDAAREMFAKKGMDLSTIAAITERAGVGKGTFYHHFQDKNEVIRELLAAIMQELCSAIDSRCREIDEPEGLLDGLIKAHFEFFAERRDDFVLYSQVRADLAIKESYQGIDEPILRYLDHVAGLLDKVIKYRLAEIARTRIACAVSGFVFGYFSLAVIAYKQDRPEATLDPVRKALVAGLSQFIKETISQNVAIEDADISPKTS